MAVKISMPKLSDTMKEGRLIRWHKNVGDEVKPGDLLAEVETDKANMDLESFDKGILLARLVAENEKVPVGACLAVIGAAKENIEAMLKEIVGSSVSDGSRPPIPARPELVEGRAGPLGADPLMVRQAHHERREETPIINVVVNKMPPPTSAPPSAAASRAGVLVSPVAARIAAEHGIPLASVPGTGPGGRIVRKDIETILDHGLETRLPSRSHVESTAIQIENKLVESLVPLEGMRKVIAERMVQAKQTIPHFYLQDMIRMDRLVGLRMAMNSHLPADASLSYNDFLMMGAAKALMMNPNLNATFDGIGVHLHGTVDIAFAVALENGLITPVIRRCEGLGLNEIRAAGTELADRARKMKLKPDEYLGGSFTVSNLGMYGLENFQAIINPPQVAILAVAAVKQEPCVDDEGHIYVGRRMGVTLACDHRVLDGAVGAKFLKDLRILLEHPESWAK